jgi:hypothetical protein
VIRILALFAFAVAVVAFRRPDQIAAPALWTEEGRHILRNYAECGFSCALLRPIHGNLCLSAKLLLLPVLKISIFNAPAIAAALGIMFNAAVTCAVALAPTHLKMRWLCAVSVLLLPSGTENFGTVIYSVWWCAILIALALLWDTSKGLHWLRLAFLVLGGLSTPFILVAGPLFVVRAWRERNAHEVTCAITAAALTIIAAVAAAEATPMHPFDINLTTAAPGLTVAKFFGLYIWPEPDPHASVVAGVLFLAAVVALIWHQRRQLDFYFVLLIALLAGSIGGNLLRTTMVVIHPWGAGCRYFFLTYTFIGFVMLWLSGVSRPMLLKAAPLSIMAISIVGAMQQTFFTHPVQQRPSWATEMKICAERPGATTMALGYNWPLIMLQEDCRALIDGSLIKR